MTTSSAVNDEIFVKITTFPLLSYRFAGEAIVPRFKHRVSEVLTSGDVSLSNIVMFLGCNYTYACVSVVSCLLGTRVVLVEKDLQRILFTIIIIWLVFHIVWDLLLEVLNICYFSKGMVRNSISMG